MWRRPLPLRHTSQNLNFERFFFGMKMHFTKTFCCHWSANTNCSNLITRLLSASGGGGEGPSSPRHRGVPHPRSLWARNATTARRLILAAGHDGFRRRKIKANTRCGTNTKDSKLHRDEMCTAQVISRCKAETETYAFLERTYRVVQKGIKSY